MMLGNLRSLMKRVWATRPSSPLNGASGHVDRSVVIFVRRSDIARHPHSGLSLRRNNVQFNKKYLVLIPALLMAGFIGCSDDDDPPASNNNNNTGNNNNNNTGGVANVITGDPTDLTQRGQWGGIVLSGFGVNSSNENGELLTEAAPQDESRFFAGSDNTDSSGSLRYAIIAESGFTFRDGQEVQGLTVEAAGSNTTVEFLQVIGSEDDGIEWFGGAAPGKWLLVQGQDDDALDQDEGYQGNIQFAIVLMGRTEGDLGIESDGKIGNTPATAPNMSNITIIGASGKVSAPSYGALHREEWQGKVYRSVYTDDVRTGTSTTFDLGCLDIDDALPAPLEYFDVIFNCTTGTDNLVAAPADTDMLQQMGVTNGQIEFTDGAGLTINEATLGINVTGVTGLPANLEPLPAGFDAAAYHGAVDPTNTSTAWWQGWTYINSGVEANLPGADFHPLQAEIEDGTLAPAAANACSTLAGGSDVTYQDGGVVTIFGEDFPVCVVSGRITEDASWPANHVFLLDGTINVGSGDAEGATATDGPTLTIAPGTQVFAQEGTATSLVVTRGAEIDAQGTSALPIIFGSVAADLSGL